MNKPTREQKKIINHEEGHALVSACPGSGKTTTCLQLARRLAGISTGKVLFLSFGKEISRENQTKLQDMIGQQDSSVVEVSTIHAFGLKLLRKHHTLLGLPVRLKLSKKTTLGSLIKKIAKAKSLCAKELTEAVNRCQDGGFLDDMGKTLRDAAKQVIRQRDTNLFRKGRIGYNDMVGLALQLLRKHPKARQGLAGEYQHLIVDEVQDIDPVQAKLLVLLARLIRSSVMVGDPRQSVYGFRGASPKTWKMIEARLKPVRLTLSESFRLPRQLLPMVNHLERQIEPDLPKTVSLNEGHAPELRRLGDFGDQLEFVAEKIRSLVEKGVDPKEIACLGRKRHHLSQLAVGLVSRGIACEETYRPEGAAHKEMLAVLVKTAQILRTRAQRRNKTLLPKELEAIKSFVDQMLFLAKTREHIKSRLGKGDISNLIQAKVRSPFYHAARNLSKALMGASQATNTDTALELLISAMRPLLRKRYGKSHELYLRDLGEMKQTAKQYPAIDTIDTTKLLPTRPKDGIVLATAHAAKGREWDYVFLINVVDGVFPSVQASNDEEKLKEEARVFYVAATRAREKLWLLETPVPQRIYRKTGGKGRAKPAVLTSRSRFVTPKRQKMRERQG